MKLIVIRKMDSSQKYYGLTLQVPEVETRYSTSPKEITVWVDRDAKFLTANDDWFNGITVGDVFDLAPRKAPGPG